MAQAIIGGRTYAIAPFKLRELRRAAPYIDKVSARARAGRLDSIEGLAQAAYDILCVLEVGIEGVTAQTLEAEASLEEMIALRAAFDQVLQEAGLKPAGDGAPPGGGPPPGEPQPAAGPAARVQAQASPSASTISSPNSSPAAAATGTP